MRALAQRLGPLGAALVVVGDRKGPRRFELDGATFLSLEAQSQLPFTLATSLPTDHYARKNLGYLKAIDDGARCIYETDDDNAPNPAWSPRTQIVPARAVSQEGWVNAYRLFTDEFIWPRGFPPNLIRAGFSAEPPATAGAEAVDAPIQQGLADRSPDVDALWRLLYDRDIRFLRSESIWLAPGSWCPFNSQSTWWWPDAFALMYLPSFASFRMTDIWRGLIAQRCLWEGGRGVVFHAPEVDQHRNPHDLMGDFEAEWSGYLGNERFASVLLDTALRPGIENAGANLLRCYEVLIERDFLPSKELELVRSWIADLEAVLARRR